MCLTWPAPAGGPGPKLESWAFAIDAEGLRVVLARGVFHLHLCKLCTDGVVVMGEYGITAALFDAGYTIDTLMAKYGDVDWHDRSNWNCNDQACPPCMVPQTPAPPTPHWAKPGQSTNFLPTRKSSALRRAITGGGPGYAGSFAVLRNRSAFDRVTGRGDVNWWVFCLGGPVAADHMPATALLVHALRLHDCPSTRPPCMHRCHRNVDARPASAPSRPPAAHAGRRRPPRHPPPPLPPAPGTCDSVRWGAWERGTARRLQVHPSRHGTYDGISMNPYEVVFLKASWHVGEPFADKYAAWQTRILKGQRSTSGAFDEPMYRFAIQCAATTPLPPPPAPNPPAHPRPCCPASRLLPSRHPLPRTTVSLQTMARHRSREPTAPSTCRPRPRQLTPRDSLLRLSPATWRHPIQSLPHAVRVRPSTVHSHLHTRERPHRRDVYERGVGDEVGAMGGAAWVVLQAMADPSLLAPRCSASPGWHPTGPSHGLRLLPRPPPRGLPHPRLCCRPRPSPNA